MKYHKHEDEIAIQNAVFTRKGVEGAMRYAFELAKKRRKHVTSATKSNGIYHTMPFWDSIFQEVKSDYPEVQTASYHIDALASFFVSRPQIFDVIVASNLFGDILTDIGGAIMDSIGIAPSINVNLNGKYPSMFEPVHGSAPDIYGRGIANPIGQIWTAKMMLDYYEEEEIGGALHQIMEEVLESGLRTPDVGGKATTREVGQAICQKILELA
jgi:tartrate dehydrogenase/decarboxylase/D-malate dehydrogenase